MVGVDTLHHLPDLAATWQVDRILLTGMGGAVAVGLFSIAYKFIEATKPMADNMVLPLFPGFSRHQGGRGRTGPAEARDTPGRRTVAFVDRADGDQAEGQDRRRGGRHLSRRRDWPRLRRVVEPGPFWAYTRSMTGRWRRGLLVAGCLVLVSCGGQEGPTGATPTPSPSPSSSPFPSGVYALQAFDGPADSDVLRNPNVAGLAVRTRWSSLEPRSGQYDWSYLDAQIAVARSSGKRVAVYVAATPSWVFDDGAKAFPAADGALPVPWDDVFLDRWTRFIRAFGARYADEPIIAYTRGSTESLTGGWSLQETGKDGANWIAYGYTPEKMIDAMTRVVDTFLTAFPKTHHWAEIGSIQFEPQASGRERTYVAGEIARYGTARYPGRFGVWRENLSGCVPYPPDKVVNDQWVLALQFSGEIGAQMLWSVQDGPTRMNQCGLTPNDKASVLSAAVQRGLQYGMRYVEIYKADVKDPDLAAVVSNAAVSLARN